MLERKNLTLALSDVCLKASGEGYSFEGYASKFNGVDSYGDTILPGAYKNALATLRKEGRSPKMFFNHKSYDLPVGKWRKYEEDEDGLFVAGSLTKGMTLVEDLKLAIADGTLDGLSVGIGLKPDDYEWVEDPKSSISRIIKNVTSLREISLVAFPADDKGRIDMGSIKAELESVESLADLETFLREAGGFSKASALAVVAQAKKILRSESGAVDEAKNETSDLLQAFHLPALT
jgi:HK97 family phage prohead protease